MKRTLCNSFIALNLIFLLLLGSLAVFTTNETEWSGNFGSEKHDALPKTSFTDFYEESIRENYMHENEANDPCHYSYYGVKNPDDEIEVVSHWGLDLHHGGNIVNIHYGNNDVFYAIHLSYCGIYLYNETSGDEVFSFKKDPNNPATYLIVDDLVLDSFTWFGIDIMKNEYNSNAMKYGFILYTVPGFKSWSGIEIPEIIRMTQTKENGKPVAHYGFVYRQMSAKVEDNNIINWMVNTTFDIRFNIHVILYEGEISVKVDMNLENFSINEEFLGVYKLKDLRLAVRYWYSVHGFGMDQNTYNELQESLEEEYEGIMGNETTRILNSSTLKINQEQIASINFGNKYILNNSRELDLSTSAYQTPQDPFSFSFFDLAFAHNFPEFNGYSITLDPEISAQYDEDGDGDEDEKEDESMLLLIAIVIACACVGATSISAIILVKKRAKAKKLEESKIRNEDI